MLRTHVSLILTAVFLVLASAAATPASEESEPTDLETLLTWMTGSFSSQLQAEADPENYHDIRLEMAPVWTERSDAHYLYVEQAAASHLDHPYRQRVYRVSEPEPGLFTSEVYALPDPDMAVGAWKLDDPLRDLCFEDLTVRVGCTVYLQREADGSFTGSTHEKDCTSSLRGATYATTEIEMTAEKIISWDRGFDAEDQHVWGADKGGYVFLRVER